MDTIELRSPDDAREFLWQGLWLQRVDPPAAGKVRRVLEWCLELASGGHPLPPTGFVADLGELAFGADSGLTRYAPPPVANWPAGLAQSYEDHVLGKVFSDNSFERAADTLRGYGPKDQTRGLAFVIRQVCERAGVGGVEVPPAAVRSLLSGPPEEVLSQGYESLRRDGPTAMLVGQCETLVRAFRRAGDLLAPEDVIALEQRTAVADLSQFVAHRQIVQTAAQIEAFLPAQPVRPVAGRKEVPTRVAADDQYPVGGYSSLSNRGSIESLLHSQLAYMEPESPDLFDTKFVRDELFYYSRDENQFLRRRRTFVIALFPDLAAARFKDVELPTQRIVLVLAAVLVLVRRLTDWLSTDALRVELVFVRTGMTAPLAHERELLTLLLGEWVARGDAEIREADGADGLAGFCTSLGRTSQTHCLTVSAAAVPLVADGVVVTGLTVAGPRPELTDGHGVVSGFPDDEPFECWVAAVARVLALWV